MSLSPLKVKLLVLQFVSSQIVTWLDYNMSGKFDEAHNGLVSIVFTSLFPFMSIVTLISDLKNQ